MDAIYVKGAVISPGWIGRPELGQTDRPLTALEIQKAAYSFPLGSPLFDYKQPVVDVQHDFNPQALAVEQFIAPEPIEFNNDVYDPGTWFLTSKVTDPTIQRMILSGELTGYSVGAFPEEYRQLFVKKGMFADVPEGGWFPLAVSMVKMPFYPKAVFKVFGPDDIIKKSLNFNSEVDTVSGEEDKGMAGLVNRLLDIVIKKEGSDDGKQYETELEKKVRELKEKQSELEAENKKLTKKVERLKSKSDDDKKPPGNDDDDDEEEDEDKEEKKKSKKSKKSKKGKTGKSKKSKEEKENEEEEDTEDEEDDEEEEVDEKEEKIIKKGLSPDNKKTKPEKSFNERAGMDPLGRNPKYL